MHALSESRRRFYACIRETYKLPSHALLAIIQAKARYSTRLRTAALRNLVCTSPVDVTQGKPYATKRRIVRAHYGI